MNDNEIVTFLFRAIDLYIRTQSAHLTFLLLRVARESFIVDQCSWAIHHALPQLEAFGGGKYHLWFERMFELRNGKSKKIDLALIPITDGKEEIDSSFLLQFKTAHPTWPSHWGGIKTDLDDLAGEERAFSVVFIYSFDEVADSSWLPCFNCGVTPSGFIDLEKKISERLDLNPFWQGTPFPMITDETKSIGQLVVWKPTIGYLRRNS